MIFGVFTLLNTGNFERSGREGFAEGAEEIQKEYQKVNINYLYGNVKLIANYYHLTLTLGNFFINCGIFSVFLLRSLRNLRVFCVQKISFLPRQTQIAIENRP